MPDVYSLSQLLGYHTLTSGSLVICQALIVYHPERQVTCCEFVCLFVYFGWSLLFGVGGGMTFKICEQPSNDIATFMEELIKFDTL